MMMMMMMMMCVGGKVAIAEYHNTGHLKPIFFIFFIYQRLTILRRVNDLFRNACLANITIFQIGL
jgi:hypothetical protein